jgi:MFS family permease
MLVLARLSGRIDRLKTMAISTLCIGVCQLVLATTPPVPGYVTTIITSSIVSSPLFVFAYALCAAGAENVGAGAGIVIGMLNTSWAAASLVGPVAAGALAALASDALPYALTVGAAAVTWAYVERTRRLVRQSSTLSLPIAPPHREPHSEEAT